MKTAGYKRNLNHTYLIIEDELRYEEDYQIRMIKENHIQGLLPLRGRGVDGSSQYSYDISGKISAKAMYEKARLHREDMIKIIHDLMQAVKAVRNHMLDINCILLDTDYIFYEEESFYYCYYPRNKGNLCDAFHRLSEYFVSQVDYEEKEGVYMAYEIHKATMEENYSLEKVIARIEEESAPKEEKTRTDENIQDNTEEKSYHDLAEEADLDIGHIRETKSMFTPVKKILNRKKKAKWGDWDQLLLDEDDL